MRYEKGRKDTSRRRIIEVATERFKEDGIAASGLAGIMSEAGLTNGAFYPHFHSKSELVRESVVAALEDQTNLLRQVLASGGVERVISSYLSAEHRDNPAKGCTCAALLPEIARQPTETRVVVADRLLHAVHQVSAALPREIPDPEGTAIALEAILIGTLQLARAVQGTSLSDRILTAGTDAARTLVRPRQDQDAR